MYLISHRGNNNQKYKENTINALINAYKTPYIDGIELDIRMTKDNIIVLSHDNIKDGKIINKTKYKKLKLDKLEDLLKKLSNEKKIIIDIKEENKKIIDILYKTIKEYDYKFYICSFNYKIINMFKTKYNKFKSGLIIGYMINIDKIHNKLDFNSLQYNLIKRINKNKEIFIWTVNDKKTLNKILKYKKDINIITDKAYLLK